MTSKNKIQFIGIAICIFCICGCKKSTDVVRPSSSLTRQQIIDGYTYYIDTSLKAIGLPGIGEYKVDPNKDYLTNREAARDTYRHSNEISKKKINYSY